MKIFSTLALFIVISLVSCGGTSAPEKKAKKEKNQLVLIETIYGDMKVKLYNETPLHRDNFLKLVNEGFYDSLLFHRVIKEFMIQGGDPESKNAPTKKSLGSGGPGYKINAEIVPGLYHKKGALAAAREGDQVNPEKKSSGSQFYIVQGKPFTAAELAQLEEKINFPKKRDLVFACINKPENAALKQKIDSLQKRRAGNELNQEYEKVAAIVNDEYLASDLFKYNEEQIEVLTTIGGTPHLDQNYTVFGEIIEGLNVIDSIAQVKTASGDRPIEDIIMKIKVVKR